MTQSLPPLTYRTICPSWVATGRFGTCKTIIQSRLASQQPSARPPSAGSRPWPHPQGALILGSTSSSFAEVCRSWQPSPSADPHSREEQTRSGNEEGRLVLACCVIASGGSSCWIVATGLRVTVKLTDLETDRFAMHLVLSFGAFMKLSSESTRLLSAGMMPDGVSDKDRESFPK